MPHLLLQNASVAFVTECCNTYHKMRESLQNSENVVTKYVGYYKMRRYDKMPQNAPFTL